MASRYPRYARVFASAGAIFRGEAVEEGRSLDISDAKLRSVALVADIATDGRRGAAGAGAHHHPGRNRVPLLTQLLEDGFGDVVVAAPVGRALGMGELVHEMTAQSYSQFGRLGIDAPAVVGEMAAAAIVLYRGDLLPRGGTRHYRIEGTPIMRAK